MPSLRLDFRQFYLATHIILLDLQTAPEKVMVDMAITHDARTLAVACADRTVLLYSTTGMGLIIPSIGLYTANLRNWPQLR